MYTVVAILDMADMVCLAQSILPHAGKRLYEVKIKAEHWQLKYTYHCNKAKLTVLLPMEALDNA